MHVCRAVSGNHLAQRNRAAPCDAQCSRRCPVVVYLLVPFSPVPSFVLTRYVRARAAAPGPARHRTAVAAAPGPARHRTVETSMLSPVVMHRPYGGSGSSCQPATFATAVPIDSWLELEASTADELRGSMVKWQCPSLLPWPAGAHGSGPGISMPSRWTRSQRQLTVRLKCAAVADSTAFGPSGAASCTPAQTKNSSGGYARTPRSP